MEVNNLSDPVEGDKLKNRFYGESEVVYREPSPVKPESTKKEDVIRGLWRDRLFDRQTELLQKHVEFSQRQQTELCEAIKAAWSAKEAEVTLDRDMLLKILEAKSTESQQQTKAILDKISMQSATSTGQLEIDTVVQPVKAELKALQFQLQRLTEKQLVSESNATAPASLAATATLPTSFTPTADLTYYAKMRAEIAEISAELANCTWVPRKAKKVEVTPPANFVLRTFGESPKTSNPNTKVASTKNTVKARPPTPSAAKAVGSRLIPTKPPQPKLTPARLHRPSPDKPRTPPKQITVSPARPDVQILVDKKRPAETRFDMQTNTDETEVGTLPMRRHPLDYIGIDDLFIDIPQTSMLRRASPRPVVSPSRALSVVIADSVSMAGDQGRLRSPTALPMEARTAKTVIVSPSPVSVPSLAASGVQGDKSVGEISLSSGEVSSNNSLSYW